MSLTKSWILLVLVGTVPAACRRNPPGGIPARDGAVGGHGGDPAPGAGRAGTGGGRGGAAGEVTTGQDPEIWRNAPGAWKTVPGTERCPVHELDVRTVQPPPRIWQTCGVGCETASANAFDTDRTTQRASLTAAFLRGDIYIRSVSVASGYQFASIWRVSDGHTTAAILQRPYGACSFRAGSRGAPQVLPFFFSVGQDLFATSALDDSPLIWSPLQSGLPLQTGIFANDLGWGMAFEDGSVRVLNPPTTTQVATVDRSLLVGRATARGNLVVWTAAVTSGPDVIKAYRPAQPVSVLVAGATRIANVALSDTAVVWVAVSGPSINEGTYQQAEISWAAWPEQLATVAAKGQVTVPGVNSTGFVLLQAGPDHVASVYCQAERCGLLVVQLSSKKVWSIGPRPGTTFMDTLAISDREIIVAEADDPLPVAQRQDIPRITRLNLTHLDDLQSAHPFR